MRYREIRRVTSEHDGITVHLKLQLSLNEYYCLSWRTLLISKHDNHLWDDLTLAVGQHHTRR